MRFLKRRNEKLSPLYIENGGKLLEGLIASSNGKYNIPYRVLTVEELNKATNVDFPVLSEDDSRAVMRDGTGNYFSGIFQQRSILVKKFHFYGNEDKLASYAVNDIVVTVLMNRHKNVLKVLGCCLDLEIPAIIYEIDMINCKLLRDLLYRKIEGDNIDSNGVAKLVDFSFCVALPPGKSQVQVDIVVQTTYFLDFEYLETGIITEKVDVYMFGIILLELLTGSGLFKVDDKYTPLVNDVANSSVDAAVNWAGQRCLELLRKDERRRRRLAEQREERRRRRWLHREEGGMEFIFEISLGYKIPSSLFMYLQLKHLKLSACLINPPPTFKGFNRLIRLELCNVNIDAEVLKSLISSCPLLEQLLLDFPIEFDLEIDAPMLRLFQLRCFCSSIYIKRSLHLAAVTVTAYDHYAVDDINYGNCNFVEFFDSLPALHKLYMDFYFMLVSSSNNASNFFNPP
ncbi:unnamed protein product [Fraxinus pennsylvanica]|uniref:Protein kinase domain-containing protein n=1 Tax=Fraxinus pennsylvanica TaxID=56036 RepID=A0AAD2A9M9_9LAMI|nr:unnamed protein product [Fraxinus pennsylvanica]